MLKRMITTEFAGGGAPENKTTVMFYTGFTLAEVLITLGILGIVIAMTMPFLINKYQRIVTVERLKRAYALVETAVQTYRAENDGNDLDSTPIMGQYYNNRIIDMSRFGKMMSSHLQTLKEGHFKDWMCLRAGETPRYKNLRNGILGYNTGINNTSSYYLELNDGTCIGFYRSGYSWGNTSYGNSDNVLQVFIDIDGSHRGPNLLGKDTFSFYLMKDGKLLPRGYDTYSDRDSCRGKSPGDEGYNCAARIIYDGWRIIDVHSFNFN